MYEERQWCVLPEGGSHEFAATSFFFNLRGRSASRQYERALSLTTSLSLNSSLAGSSRHDQFQRFRRLKSCLRHRLRPAGRFPSILFDAGHRRRRTDRSAVVRTMRLLNTNRNFL